MDHERASNRIVVVGSEVGMIPVESVFLCHGEFVGEVTTGSDGILV